MKQVEMTIHIQHCINQASFFEFDRKREREREREREGESYIKSLDTFYCCAQEGHSYIILFNILDYFSPAWVIEGKKRSERSKASRIPRHFCVAKPAVESKEESLLRLRALGEGKDQRSGSTLRKVHARGGGYGGECTSSQLR